MSRRGWGVAALAALLAWTPRPGLPGVAAQGGRTGSGQAPPAAARQGLACERCHGELELLRQHVQTLEGARGLVVRQGTLSSSAHGDLACGECHGGFARFPHPASATTRACAACHEEAAGDWTEGAHAGEAEEAVACAACHGVHDVIPADSLVEGPAVRAMSARCVACHETQRLPVDAPHQDHAGCYACHAAHEVIPPELPGSWMATANQARVCGACHDTVAAAWSGGVHGRTVLAGSEAEERAPTCSSCHGAHPVIGSGEGGFSAAAVERCVACHEKAGETFFGSYHGKATALGSRIAATCVDCHGAHGIEPASSPESRVAPANLVATCGACHEHARAAFVRYDAHPDPMDRERNPVLFYSFWFMNTLLIGTLTVFGLHTLLWWIRITLDRRRGLEHAEGGAGE